MNKRKKRTIAVAVTLLALAILAVFLFVPFDTTRAFVADEYKYSLDTSIELEGIPVFSQETGYTCYAVSMVIMKTYLGYDATEQELIENLGLQARGEGMVPSEYMPYAEEEFGPLSYSVSLQNPKSEAEILNVITESLSNGLPVIFFYSAVDDWNKPNYNTHYGVIYGIDMVNEKVKLSNPYGYLEELSFDELFAGMDFESYQNEPLLHRIGRSVGYIKNNNLIVFEKIV